MSGVQEVVERDYRRRNADGLSRVWGRTHAFRPVLVLLVLLVSILCITQPDFRTWQNTQNLLTSVAALWVIAMGMTLVLISGGFDLSVGSIAAISGYTMGKLLESALPGWLALISVILFGAAIGGVINGLPVGRLRLNVFVVTLASMTSLAGALNVWSGTNSIYLDSPLANQLALDKLAGIPTPIWIMAATFAIFLYLQTRTYFGRDIYAIGGSPTAARLSGIRTVRTLALVYATVGACAALAGMIDVSRAGAASPLPNNTIALNAIAAVVLGGVPLTGGIGGVGGTALGVLFIGALQNGLSISGVASSWQQVLTGVILVAAVLGVRYQAGGFKARFRRRRPQVE